MMNASIISESKQPEILKFLHAGNFNEVVKLTSYTNEKSNEINFAYKILNSCLSDKLNPKNYSEIQKLDFKEEFIADLIELYRIILTLEDFNNASNYEDQISLTLLECIRDGALYIEQNANNYPQNSISADIWMNGLGLRNRADELSDYYKRKKDDRNELDALFLKAKLTNTIMSHYPESVGPDMIAVGSKFEQLAYTEKAKQYYRAVVLDFSDLVLHIKENISDSKNEVMNEDIPIIQSLIHALEGLKRLGESIDEEALSEAKELIDKIT